MYVHNEWEQQSWMGWIQANWNQFAGGKQLRTPWGLPHPRHAGFERPPLAEPAGQVDDWVMSFEDGSRIHLHEQADGTFIAHRDATDPKLGLVPALWHWFTESTSGRTVAVMGGIFLVASLLNSEE